MEYLSYGDAYSVGEASATHPGTGEPYLDDLRAAEARLSGERRLLKTYTPDTMDYAETYNACQYWQGIVNGMRSVIGDR